MARTQGPSPEDLFLRVARQIASARSAKGLTQEALARALGMATKNLQRIESGRQNLTLRSIAELALALDVDPEALVARPTHTDSAEVWAPLLKAGFTVLPGDESPPKSAVPIYSLAAAAGSLGGNHAVERLGWAVLPKQRRGTTERHFLARASGRSMEPLIPDGAWCLFRADVSGPLEGRIVLIQHRDIRDPETEGAFALKRLGGIEADAEGISVRLESLNPRHPAYRVRLNALEELRAIAEFVRVIAPRPRVTPS